MKRQALTDDTGQWFDTDAAEMFEEDSQWNGNNNISLATNSQWNHERLYRTASKTWVLNWWSQMQGSRESWTELSDAEAAIWLVKNNQESEIVADEIAELEI
jgi:AICAR transformylase/IMP cyclohydrolase PurH